MMKSSWRVSSWSAFQLLDPHHFLCAHWVILSRRFVPLLQQLLPNNGMIQELVQAISLQTRTHEKPKAFARWWSRLTPQGREQCHSVSPSFGGMDQEWNLSNSEDLGAVHDEESPEDLWQPPSRPWRLPRQRPTIFSYHTSDGVFGDSMRPPPACL